jgi:D-aminoacyl-tRNA deacylase
MRVLVQRVGEAEVETEGRLLARIGRGFLILVCIGEEDAADGGSALEPMAAKILNLRILPDEDGKMNRSLLDIKGEILAVSQFTLHADCRRGRRPSFTHAAPPELARALFDRWIEILRRSGLRVETGEFGAMMRVSLVNEGPVTIWLDSRDVLGGGAGDSD